MWASLVGLSIGALLILDYFPSGVFGDIPFVSSTINYAVTAGVAYVLVILLGSPSLEYFRLPRIHVKSLLVFVLVSPMIFHSVTHEDLESKQLSETILGIIFLLSIGIGEEIFSRGVIFGVLRRFGQWRAIFGSSLLFALMHLNLYTGKSWDAWQAYAHVWSTFGFGVLMCAVMITTRSIWASVVLHAIIDWGVVFGKDPVSKEPLSDWQFDSLWAGFTYPLSEAAFTIGLAWLLLRINRGGAPRIPRWVHRVALKWKLVEPEFALPYWERSAV
jgi:membrane protease YdiL (CAAX protease family)